jgi:hypothetical protein
MDIFHDYIIFTDSQPQKKEQQIDGQTDPSLHFTEKKSSAAH